MFSYTQWMDCRRQVTVAMLILCAFVTHAEMSLALDGRPGKPASTIRVEGVDLKPVLHRMPNGALVFDGAVPDTYRYTDRGSESLATKNATSLRFAANESQSDYLSMKLPDHTGSFTMELFVRADSLDAAIKPKRSLPVMSIRTGDEFEKGDAAAPIAELRVNQSRPPHSYPWWVATCDGIDRRVPLSRNRYNGISHVKSEVWRHLAFVYDHEQQTASFYIDYTLQERRKLTQPIDRRNATLLIGGQPNGRGFIGLIDEPRLTEQTLQPHEFLRATPHELKGVTFKSLTTLLPEDSGYVDVRLRYGAVGDGRTDDTAAIQRALAELDNRIPLAFNTLYFPPGTYLVSRPLTWDRYLVVQGAGRDKTTLKLKDHAEGFGDPSDPDCFIYAGWGEWKGRKGNAGNVMANYLMDLTIDTGKGNPGAVGVSFHSNNTGSIRNVTIQSGDGAGVTGLDFSKPWPGPTLIQHVEIQGFDTGIATGWQEYSLVFEHIKLHGQRKIGIRNGGNLLTIRGLDSFNSVPVIQSGGAGMVSLIDSQLRRIKVEDLADSRVVQPQETDVPAIINLNEGGLFLRNVKTPDYKVAVAEQTRERRPRGEPPATPVTVNTIAGPITEYVSGQVTSAFERPAESMRSLNLPIMQEPRVDFTDHTGWVNVMQFKEHVVDGDWAPALQQAIDSGAKTLYFPANERVAVASTVVLRGKVQQLVGMKNGIGRHKALKEAGKPAVRIDGPAGTQVIFERLSADHVEHTGKQSVVFNHGGPRLYEARPGAGDAYFTDTGGHYRFAKGQRVWARQFNPEAKHTPEIVNDGADLWVLGLKTEYGSINIINQNGARTEVLGGLIYPVNSTTPEMPMFQNTDATLSITIGVSAYRADHQVYVRDTQGGKTVDFLRKNVSHKGARRQIHLYRSQPE